MGLIVRLAPFGVLGAVAYTVGQYGVGSIRQLLSLVVLFWVAVAFFVVVILGSMMRLATGLNILRFLAYFREELTIVWQPHHPTPCCRRSCASWSGWASSRPSSVW
jgi:aerobic C4-dicarboxylate transport protein